MLGYQYDLFTGDIAIGRLLVQRTSLYHNIRAQFLAMLAFMINALRLWYGVRWWTASSSALICQRQKLRILERGLPLGYVTPTCSYMLAALRPRRTSIFWWPRSNALQSESSLP